MIFGYVRVSSDTQKDGTSPEDQERKCRAIAQLHSTSPYDFALFRDDAVSGSVPLGLRPQGQEMLAAAQSGDTIIASKLDRMFRNTLDALQSLETFKQRGIFVILADLSSEPVTGEGIGKLVFGLMAMFADFERERINVRTAEGRKAKKASGGHVGGSAPYGFSVEGKGKTARLVSNPDEQKVIARVVELSAKWSPALVVRQLAKEGYRTRDNWEFEHVQVKRIRERYATAS